jgi:hypothetical protein
MRDGLRNMLRRMIVLEPAPHNGRRKSYTGNGAKDLITIEEF